MVQSLARPARAGQSVADVMTSQVVTVGPDVGFREAVRLLQEAHVGALPVVDDGALVGVLAQSDLLVKEEACDRPPTVLPWRRRDRARAGATTVRQVMTPRPRTIRPTATVSAAAHEMHRHRVGGLPVVDEQGRLVGVVTRSDLLRVFLRTDEELQLEVERAISPLVGGDVTCRVLDGRVRLEGQVRYLSRVQRASAAASHVDGVVDVHSAVRAEVDDVNVAMMGP